MMLVAPANLVLAYAPPLALLLVFRRAAALADSDPRIVTHGFLAGIPAILPAVAVLAAVLALGAGVPLGLPAAPVRVLRSFGLSAGVEELSKLAALALVVRSHRSRLTGRVVVLAGAAAGAGFAFVENSLYLIDLPRVLLLRLLTAGVLHVSTTAICGYGIAMVAYRYGPHAAVDTLCDCSARQLQSADRSRGPGLYLGAGCAGARRTPRVVALQSCRAVSPPRPPHPRLPRQLSAATLHTA